MQAQSLCDLFGLGSSSVVAIEQNRRRDHDNRDESASHYQRELTVLARIDRAEFDDVAVGEELGLGQEDLLSSIPDDADDERQHSY